jgi:ATP:ADP antiporter, AAA family
VASVIARLPPGASVAAVASAAMIAQQVAGKAARDALFLSSFHVQRLPAMMAASAVLSLAAVFWQSRMIVKYSPARVVPVGFALSGVALLGEWALSFPAPRLAAVLVYLHTGVFGAAMISAFWSLINETFDPHTGKRAVASIAGGGTLGGVLGGVIAWRASDLIAVWTMLPLLAGVSMVSMWGTLHLMRRVPARAAVAGTADDAFASRAFAPLLVLRGAPYLRNLAWVVAFGAVTSGLLDYVFSAEAVGRYHSGRSLLAFFALFWLIVGILSFVLQAMFGRLALEKLGLAVTLALLPGVVVLGGAVGIAVPGLWSASILRGGEATQRNSLFRSAYELLYTPLSELKKRSTKTLIDVGFDRLGTVVASGIAMVVLVLVPARAEMSLLLIAVGCAFLTIARSRPLNQGYVSVLEESLREKASGTTSPTPSPMDRPSTESPEVRDKIVERLDALPRAEELAAAVNGARRLAPIVPAVEDGAGETEKQRCDEALRGAVELCSGDPERVRRVLLTQRPMSSTMASLAVILLADKMLHVDAIRALRKDATKIEGQLIDALLDPGEAFDVRRRVPRVLSECRTQIAVDGLLRGAEDARFEVRYACGRALLKITSAGAPVLVTLETVVALVGREVGLSKEIWESQGSSAVDDAEYETPALFARLLRDRVDRSLEHVFNLLALNLDPKSLQIAFSALHLEDAAIRGTALEYLENVLPDEVRDLLWPFLGEERPMRTARPADEILADLVRSSWRGEGPVGSRALG